eukprot:TRINITY_DN9875_c0_g1_i1.p1 TRINITY_DN9875_c0_g1~~TRINITY_DN9875_c0_g1_i1.p1  ORF type:complete len:1280 (-),score=230.42 TRINITY_DN9875_c0_g1_i1:23-3862(-)
MHTLAWECAKHLVRNSDQIDAYKLSILVTARELLAPAHEKMRLLSKMELAELKSMHRFPKPLLRTLEGLCILCNLQLGFQNAQRLIHDGNIVTRLLSLDALNLSDTQFQRLARCKLGKLDPLLVEKSSTKAGGVFCVWVQTFAAVADRCRVMRARLAAAQNVIDQVAAAGGTVMPDVGLVLASAGDAVDNESATPPRERREVEFDIRPSPNRAAPAGKTQRPLRAKSLPRTPASPGKSKLPTSDRHRTPSPPRQPRPRTAPRSPSRTVVALFAKPDPVLNPSSAGNDKLVPAPATGASLSSLVPNSIATTATGDRFERSRAVSKLKRPQTAGPMRLKDIAVVAPPATERILVPLAASSALVRLSSAFASQSKRFPEQHSEAVQLFSMSWRTTRAINVVRNTMLFSNPALPLAISQLHGLKHFAANDCKITSLPSELVQLVDLERLDLRSNLITELPAQIGRLTAIKTLHLNQNRLSALPESMQAMVALERLDISQNELVELPSAIFTWEHLLSLDLHDNQLHSVPCAIGRLTSLHRLDLTKNRLTTIPDELCDLLQLSVLYLSNNCLTKLPDTVGNLQRIQRLEVGHNKLTEVPEAIGALKGLNMLSLNMNSLISLPSTIGMLTQLRRLDISDNTLVALPVEICELAQLSIVNAGNNRISAITDHIGNMTALVALILHHNDLQVLPRSLALLPALKELGVEGNKNMRTPPLSVCYLGVEAVRQFLASPADQSQSPASSAEHSAIMQQPQVRLNWEIHPDEIAMGELLGRGGFGAVHKAVLRGETVAVKMMLQQDEQVDGYMVADFQHEVGLLSQIKRHPNVVRFIGACTTPPNLYLVMEYIAQGTLYDVLHSDVELPVMRIYQMALDIAMGMRHLHTCTMQPILHRDLKSRNLLVKSDMTVLVSDFGMSRVKGRSPALLSAPPGSDTISILPDGYVHMDDPSQTLVYVPYAAPEVLRREPVSEKTDVFSFALVLWELFTRQEPYAGMDCRNILEYVLQGGRPEIPDTIPSVIAELIRKCWENDADERPDFTHVAEKIREEMWRHRTPAARVRSDTDHGSNSPEACSPRPKRVTTLELDTWHQVIERWLMLSRPKLRGDAQEAYLLRRELNGKVALWKGHLHHLLCDAVVIATNRALQPLGAVARELHEHAGTALAEECKRVGACPPGQAKHTAGFALPSQNIVHATIPSREDATILRSCYMSVLQLAVRHHWKTVALPCLAGGTAYPINNAAKVALNSVHEWFEQGDNRNKVDRIIFVCSSQREFSVYRELIKTVFPPV